MLVWHQFAAGVARQYVEHVVSVPILLALAEVLLARPLLVR